MVVAVERLAVMTVTIADRPRNAARPMPARPQRPSSRRLEGLRQFIRWCRAQRRAGTYLTFGVVPTGQTTVAGFLQIWPIEQDFSTAEWGFVIGQAFWGTGVFN